MQARTCHIVSLDLGQQQDPSALAVLERAEHTDRAAYDCVELRRWHLGTPYPRIVEDVLGLLADSRLADPVLVVDQTGVGRPVVDLFRWRVGCPFRPVTITSGFTWSREPNGDYRVPKKDLAAAVQALLGYRRLRIAAELPEARTLVEEMQAFRVKVTKAGNESFAADWREGKHDDLVLAVALAAWVGEHCCAGTLEDATRGAAASEMSRAPAGVWANKEADEEEQP